MARHRRPWHPRRGEASSFVISRHIRALFLRRPVALSRTESDRSVLFYL